METKKTFCAAALGDERKKAEDRGTSGGELPVLWSAGCAPLHTIEDTADGACLRADRAYVSS